MSNKIILNPIAGQLQFVTDPENLQDIQQNDVTPLHRMTETAGGTYTEKTKVAASHKTTVMDRVAKAAGIGGAAILDGINDYLTSTGTGKSYASTESHTFIKWFYPTANNTNTTLAIGSGEASRGTNLTFFFPSAGGHQLNFYVQNNLALRTIAPVFVLNTWNFIAAAYDASTKTVLFVHGTSTGAVLNNLGTSSAFAETWSGGTDAFFIGNSPTFSGQFPAERVDETEVFNVALTFAQLQTIFNAGAGRYGSIDANRRAGWHFDEASGNALDYSGNGYHLLLQGGATLGGVGVVSVAAAIVDTQVYSSQDGTAANEEGKKEYGHCNGETKIQGRTVPFCVSGTEKAMLDSTGYHVDTITEKTANAGVAVEGVTLKDNGIAAPKWKVTDVYDQAAGPLPLTTGTFISSGGTVILMVSGSAWWSAANNLLQVNVKVDTILKGSLKKYTNEAASHKTLVGNVIVVALAAGSHTVQLEVGNGTTTSDVQDFFDVVAYEVPF